jgi:hypothetical protein
LPVLRLHWPVDTPRKTEAAGEGAACGAVFRSAGFARAPSALAGRHAAKDRGGGWWARRPYAPLPAMSSLAGGGISHAGRYVPCVLTDAWGGRSLPRPSAASGNTAIASGPRSRGARAHPRPYQGLALAAAECGLSLGARDPEAGQHYLKRHYAWILTGVPSGTNLMSRRRSLSRAWRQPADSRPPTDLSSRVPWIAKRLPPVHPAGRLG